jgi:hypothetical protein
LVLKESRVRTFLAAVEITVFLSIEACVGGLVEARFGAEQAAATTYDDAHGKSVAVFFGEREIGAAVANGTGA